VQEVAMNRCEAEVILVASRDNPFVAALVAVIDEHKVPANCEIAPQDWWDAYQDFYYLGLVNESEFRAVDVTKTFFGKKRPTTIQIQDALCQLKTLRSMSDPKEEQMPDNKFALFENEERSLIQPNNAGAVQVGTPFGSSMPRSISPFEEKASIGPVMEQGRIEQPRFNPRGGEIQPFAPTMRRRTGIACQHEVDATPRPDGLEIEFKCCGRLLDFIQDDGECLDPEDSPDGQAAIEFIFHSKCENCQTIFHFSAAKPVPNDTFRR
jgi:hypothetical protein